MGLMTRGVNMYKNSIGIMGGFGAYAGLNFYKRLIDAFSDRTERDLPHILMDNDFTMPSRTKALLYGDDYEQIVEMMAQSIRKLCEAGADYIVMVCGTVHGFLKDVYEIYPEAETKIINIIEVLASSLSNEKIERVLIVGAEGALRRKVYEKYLTDIVCISPMEEDYSVLRFFIETVKQNRIDSVAIEKLINFLDKYNENNIVLGCTEFPVLVSKCKEIDSFKKYRFWDPLEETIEELRRILE